MKKLTHLKSFNEATENLNISIVSECKNNQLQIGDTFTSKHIGKFFDNDVNIDDKIEILKVYKKTADIKLNGIIIKNVSIDDICEVKYLIYKDY